MMPMTIRSLFQPLVLSGLSLALAACVSSAPQVVKLLEGTQGVGVVLAETNSAAESVIAALRQLNANILVQEFIKEANGKDLRLFVVDGKVVASMQRQAVAGDFRANLHRSVTASSPPAAASSR